MMVEMLASQLVEWKAFAQVDWLGEKLAGMLVFL